MWGKLEGDQNRQGVSEMQGWEEHITLLAHRIELADISVQRLEFDEPIANMSQRPEGLAGQPVPGTFGEQLGKWREGERDTLPSMLFCPLDHVDAEPLVRAVRGVPATPRKVQAEVGASAGAGIAMEALYSAAPVAGDDEPYPG